MSRNVTDINRPAPLISEHTSEIMESLLGLSHEEVIDGYQDGTFWPTDTPPYSYLVESLR